MTDLADSSGVEAVTLRVATPAGHTQQVPLARGGSATWSGLLAPITALQLGLLGGTVDVAFEARDAAGNVSIAHASTRVSVLSCLG